MVVMKQSWWDLFVIRQMLSNLIPLSVEQMQTKGSLGSLSVPICSLAMRLTVFALTPNHSKNENEPKPIVKQLWSRIYGIFS